MDEETKKLLADSISLSKENNEMLKKLVLYQKWNQIYKVVYWAVIILSAIGAFYFIKPLLSNLTSVYTGGAGNVDITSIKNNLSQNQMQDLIKSLNEN